jgi:uncharacterized phage protein gp47/JayE
MPLFAKSLTELTADTLNELSRTTNITKLSPGGKARALLDTMNARVAEAYDTFDLNLTRAFVSAAQGEYLDLIGQLLGVTRTSGVAASVTDDMEVARFYVESNTFGDINGGNSIIIPLGTILSTLPDENGVLFRVTSDTVLPSTDDEAFISVEALATGELGNVGANALTYHNFRQYTDIINDTLKSTNIYPVGNGANLESDANFRFRIANRVLEVEAANETSVRLAALSTPGVADVVMLPRYRGVGTFGLLVESVTPTVSDVLIDDVQGRVDLVQGLGTIAYIRKPHEIGIAFRTTVQYDQRLDDATLTNIEFELEQAARDFIGELGIGDSFSINQLVARMFGISQNVKNLGVAGTPLEEVYIYSDSRVEDNRIKERLLGDYDPNFDERVIVEPSLTVPFIFDRTFARR